MKRGTRSSTQVGDQGANIAKTSLLYAGWPESVPGMTVGRFCASGLEAIAVAAGKVASGQADLVLAGGVESMSRVSILADKGAWFSDPAVVRATRFVPLGVAADVLATLDGRSREQLEQIDKFYRYFDKDGDAIPYRTLPGTHPKGAYFTRGSGHTQYGGYTEDSTEYQIVLDRLKRKFETAKTLVPKAVFTGRNSHDVGIVSLGSCDGAVHEALDILERRGVQLDYMRVRAFPFGQEVEEFLASHSTLFVLEQNRDAQLKSLLTLETAVEKSRLRSILYYSGLPMSSSVIVDAVLAELGASKPMAVTA